MVKILDIYMSRILIEAIGGSMSFVFLSLFFIFIGWMAPPEDVLKVLLAWIMIAAFGASLAIFLGSLSERYEIVEKLWHPASYLVFPLSGAAFLVSTLPRPAQEFVLWFPMVHGVELLREGYFGSNIEAVYDLSYMSVATLIMLCLGLALSRVIASEVVPE